LRRRRASQASRKVWKRGKYYSNARIAAVASTATASHEQWPAGTEKVLHTFGTGTDGSNPNGLIQGSDRCSAYD
jgi:hypothetical protein